MMFNEVQIIAVFLFGVLVGNVWTAWAFYRRAVKGYFDPCKNGCRKAAGAGVCPGPDPGLDGRDHREWPR